MQRNVNNRQDYQSSLFSSQLKYALCMAAGFRIYSIDCKLYEVIHYITKVIHYCYFNIRMIVNTH